MTTGAGEYSTREKQGLGTEKGDIQKLCPVPHVHEPRRAVQPHSHLAFGGRASFTHRGSLRVASEEDAGEKEFEAILAKSGLGSPAATPQRPPTTIA